MIRVNFLILPGLDNLSTLRYLGDKACLFKIDILRPCNILVDPTDAIHLGIKWDDKYYIDTYLAFGTVHGTASLK